MRIALGIEYSGENYCGWQRQKHSPSVQENLENVLSQIANQPIKVFCAGRTDTKVHATGQVIHFDMEGERPETAWLRGANNYLNSDISIVWAKKTNENFHARFSAISRSYRYIIRNSNTPPATLSGKVTWHRTPLNVDLMQQGAEYLLGEKNFASFQASSCQANTSIRKIEMVQITKNNQLVIIDIKANAFLHHMVRNIAGCLLKVGEERASPQFVEQIINHQDRKKAPDTASPNGLYLVKVEYPPIFGLPYNENGPLGVLIS